MKIVVGYLKSPEGQAALDRGVAEARLRNAELLVVHSLRGGGRDEGEEMLAYREELERVGAELEAEGLAVEIRELVRGRPAGDDLVELANEEHADLIVIGIRRRSPVGKLVLGSNAQDVLLGANCPVLAIKPAEDLEDG